MNRFFDSAATLVAVVVFQVDWSGMNDLAQRLTLLLDVSKSLPEMTFDKEGNIGGWPEESVKALRDYVKDLQAASPQEVFEASQIMKSVGHFKISRPLRTLLWRVLLDLPGCP